MQAFANATPGNPSAKAASTDIDLTIFIYETPTLDY
jgi:hypothetical protein